ncbi:ATP-binding protein [Rhodopirellula halodulae]|uniref:ATP-binding protein n=1 Tax=Rhodopirellula halodulae TaxID=2894198 RepID=UPI001E54B32C|nr:ATP-binding protein [Rhodopirellula sp. JC737]MCC9655185.1 GAF domain-containing protein [Rhodopirellula sp. JC737]
MNSHFAPGTLLDGPVDLNNCDREPIHIPAQIQAFGGLMVVRLVDREIVSVSENLDQCFSPQRCPAVGETCPDELAELVSQISAPESSDEGYAVRDRSLAIGELGWMVTAHRSGAFALLEFELESNATNASDLSLLERLFKHSSTSDLSTVYQSTVEVIRAFTGFDRVMLYQFHEDQHGSVIAEMKREDQESFLNLHYPAGDIPVPARRLYELKWIRTVADSSGETVPMVPPLIAKTSEPDADELPIDMSYSELRAISPIHLEYLRNMGVGASMSISVLDSGRLWGLIACHHDSPKVVAPKQRDACELAGVLLSTYLTSRRQQQALKHRVEVGERISAQISEIAKQDDLNQAMINAAPWMMELFNAEGLVWVHEGDVYHAGATPSEAQTRTLLSSLDQQNQDSIVYTNCVAKWQRWDDSFAERLPGMMAMRMGQRFGGMLMLFRGPHEEHLNWAGDPNKSVTDESGRLSPRKSFEQYRQTVSGQSLPWTATDRETAESLLSAMNLLVVEQAAKVRRINEELRTLNADLDAFAYAASHDLKEPLRGIHHHVYMMEQAQELAGATFEKGMQSLKRLTGRMSDLLDGLLRFSRAGRQDLQWETFSLSEVMDQAMDVAFGGLCPNDVEVQVKPDGELSGDFTCVREILTNLITNSVKYNDQQFKQIVAGITAVNDTPLGRRTEFESNVLFLRDNGIGIAPEYQSKVFEIFTRLCEPGEYSGGSGAGLTIVRRLVERHGGDVAVESDGKTGSTFFVGWAAR